MRSYPSLTETINSLPVFTQQPLLPPLDIFGSFCDQEAGRRMSDTGRMSIKSKGSPPTPPYSNMLNSSSANIRIQLDCYMVLLLHDCKLPYLFPFFVYCVYCLWLAGHNHRCPGDHMLAAVSKKKTKQKKLSRHCTWTTDIMSPQRWLWCSLIFAQKCHWCNHYASRVI